MKIFFTRFAVLSLFGVAALCTGCRDLHLHFGERTIVKQYSNGDVTSQPADDDTVAGRMRDYLDDD
jgi:hypothetical protein